MKVKQLTITFLFLLTMIPTIHADEGMWMLANLNKQSRNTMSQLGFSMPFNQLYDEHNPSLKDAIVSFGGFCSGVVVSADGLVFTNHHCGFESIQQHSTTDHDYITHGFVAQNHGQELPNPGLFVRFLVRQENVTKQIMKALRKVTDETQREAVTDSISRLIEEKATKGDKTLVGVVDGYYGGNEFWLSVYREFHDIRLVFAPPSAIGKFGWDTDNWVWPRHTGDFSVFRIYADKNNNPAEYSTENVPYHPAYVAPISLEGYQQGSFCMTIGYPGETDRFLSSYGIEERMNNSNQAMIDVRGAKQAIWKAAMEKDNDIRIKYASKYDESSNYWKNSIGMNKCIRALDIIGKKRTMEATLQRWIDATPTENMQHDLLANLKVNYQKRANANHALSYLSEAFGNGPEALQVAVDMLNLDENADKKTKLKALNELLDKIHNIDFDLDKKVYVAMLDEYEKEVPNKYLLQAYAVINNEFNGNKEAFVENLYHHSTLLTPNGFREFMERDSTYDYTKDKLFEQAIDLINTYFILMKDMGGTSDSIKVGERDFSETMRRMYSDRNFYPDANSTMRLSFGSVGSYSPADAVTYNYFTTQRGVPEKLSMYQNETDFEKDSCLLNLFNKKDFGRYADPQGDMRLCFITNNDITGGNSGSAMFNGKGELLGLAFDGNWEAMSSDLAFEPKTQRCIGVDVRYILFVIEKYGKAGNLISELHLNK